MATKVKSVKKSMTGGHKTLGRVKRQLTSRPGTRGAAAALESVQKSMSKQQVQLSVVLDRLAFHKSKRKEAEQKVRALRARLRSGG